MKYAILYISTFFIFLFIDFIWLTVISKNMYQKQIGHLMAENVKYLPAFIFYLLFVGVLLYLVIIPAVENKDLKGLIIKSILFGMITYATYDLTNLATLKNWPTQVAIIDIIWGSTLSFLTTIASYYIGINLF